MKYADKSKKIFDPPIQHEVKKMDSQVDNALEQKTGNGDKKSRLDENFRLSTKNVSYEQGVDNKLQLVNCGGTKNVVSRPRALVAEGVRFICEAAGEQGTI